jgi:hypothetical protein
MELELHQLELKYERLRIFEPGRQARLLASLSEQGQRGPDHLADPDLELHVESSSDLSHGLISYHGPPTSCPVAALRWHQSEVSNRDQNPPRSRGHIRKWRKVLEFLASACRNRTPRRLCNRRRILCSFRPCRRRIRHRPCLPWRRYRRATSVDRFRCC